MSFSLGRNKLSYENYCDFPTEFCCCVVINLEGDSDLLNAYFFSSLIKILFGKLELSSFNFISIHSLIVFAGYEFLVNFFPGSDFLLWKETSWSKLLS
jgi:hypothetical protein